MNKSFKQHLEEKRSHPEQNQKISTYEQLTKYKDDPDIYISFTRLDKIGINPNTVFYSTPAGIYCYPLKAVWKTMLHQFKEIGLPFSGRNESKYVWLFKANCSNIVDVSEYGVSDYNKDIKQIKQQYASTGLDIDSFIAQSETSYKSKGYFRVMENVLVWVLLDGKDPDTTKLNKSFPFKLNGALRKLGYCAITDKTGKGGIHGAEPIQAVFLSKTALKVVDKLENKSPMSPEKAASFRRSKELHKERMAKFYGR